MGSGPPTSFLARNQYECFLSPSQRTAAYPVEGDPPYSRVASSRDEVVLHKPEGSLTIQVSVLFLMCLLL